VCKLRCLTCEQTGRIFRERYEEHIRDIKNNEDKPRYALHILEHNHQYGPMGTTLEILTVSNKGIYLDVLDRFHI
jgi:hypothetical protein